MLTKEECDNALDRVARFCSWFSPYECPECIKLKNELDILDKLIEEHFDNPPLTHEEIEEGKWYWHNKLKFWMKIINKDVCTEIFPVMENEDGYIYFEEDTYFRKEVQE